MKNKSIVGITFIAVFFIAAICANAQTCSTADCLDDTFSTGGKVLTNINFGTGTNWATDVAVQSDGKIIVAANAANYPSGTGNDFYVLRYNTDGTLDYGFGSGGVARVSFTSTYDSENPYAVAIQPDGKIVVAGRVTINSKGSFAITRLDTNGSIDTSFGSNGKILFNFSNRQDAMARSITFQSNGNIIVAGRSDNDFAFARFTPAGAFDTSFNGLGKLVVQTAKSSDILIGGAYAMTIQRILENGVLQEKIVATGIRPAVSGVERDFATLRLNPNGTLDTTFGNGGKVFTDFYGLRNQAKGIAIDANNNIVVGGSTHTDNRTKFALIRYKINGQIDTSFGDNGKTVVGVPGTDNNQKDIAIDSSGRIVLAGWTHNGDIAGAWIEDFAVARFTPDGNLDQTFGGSGIVVTDILGIDHVSEGGVALQPDGKIVVAGMANNQYYIALVRYNP